MISMPSPRPPSRSPAEETGPRRKRRTVFSTTKWHSGGSSRAASEGDDRTDEGVPRGPVRPGHDRTRLFGPSRHVRSGTHREPQGRGPGDSSARHGGVFHRRNASGRGAGPDVGSPQRTARAASEETGEKAQERPSRARGPWDAKSESEKWLASFREVARIQALLPGTRLVSVGDRESDFHELFVLAVKNRKTTDEVPVWESLKDRPEAGTNGASVRAHRQRRDRGSGPGKVQGRPSGPSF